MTPRSPRRSSRNQGSRRHGARRHSSRRDGDRRNSARKEGSKRRDKNAGDIDDSVEVPPKGFLKAENIILPTYKRKTAPEPDFSHLGYVRLTIQHVLSAIGENIKYARCNVWEIARLKKRKRDFFKSLELSQEARKLDKKLVKLREVVSEGDDLIEVSGDDVSKQGLVIKGKAFEKAQAEAKNSLLDLQKRFYDEVRAKLRECRKREESVDHDGLIATIEDIHDKLLIVYRKLKFVHDEEMKAIGAE